MAGSVSKTILVGRLGKDPETRTFQNGGKVVNFSLATSENWKDNASGEPKERTEWHNIVIHNTNLADFAGDHLKKGDLVYLEGRNETRTWVKDRQTHYTTEVVLRQFGSALQILQRKDADRPEAEQGRARAARTADGPV